MKQKLLWTVAAIAVIGVVVALSTDIGTLGTGGDMKSGGHVNAVPLGKDDHSDAADNHDADKKSSGTGNNDKHEDDEGAIVRLTETQIKVAGIETVETTAGEIGQTVQLTGEVRVNEDRVVQVVPIVPGVVQSVSALLGDIVSAGAVMAVLDSRELADAKSTYFGSRERTSLAQTKSNSEENLWRKRISSEQEYLNAKSALAEAQIEQRGAAQKLRALGVSPDALKDDSGTALTRFEVTAPLDGTVIEKNVTAGASINTGQQIYRIADLRTVWVIASVYEKNIAQIAKGQAASIRTGAYPEREFQGRVSWIADILDEQSRTLKVRIEVDNEHRLLKPGMFVQAAVTVETKSGVLTIPTAAIRRQGGETIVFVDEGGGRFERREVSLGVQSNGATEIQNGLKLGERVVFAGSFILKSEFEKEGFGGGHGH